MSVTKYARYGNSFQKVKNPTHKQLRQIKYDQNRLARNRAYIEIEKERRGCCEFCRKEYAPEIYQWHHIWDNDKTKEKISRLCGRSTNARLDKEFAKVVMLCPNCHSTFHHNLCCMLEHKQHHIDGTFEMLGYEDTIEENLKEPIKNTLKKFLL